MDAFNRCKQLGGKVKIIVINPDAPKNKQEKRRVCSLKHKDPKKAWGPVAEGVPYVSKKESIKLKKKNNKK